MKKILPSIIVCSVTCIIFTAVHAGEILGTLKQVSVGQTGVEVLIEVDGTYSGPCSDTHIDNYNFSYQTDTTKGKFIHSTLLSAYSMGKNVVVVGNGTCLTGDTEIERVQYVKLGGGLPGGTPNNAPTIDNPPGPLTNTVDEDITDIQLTATDLDGDSPLNFDDNNTLPTGINITNNGLISGRPTVVGTSSVVITVDDGTDNTSSAPFNWTVQAAGGGGGSVTYEFENEVAFEISGFSTSTGLETKSSGQASEGLYTLVKSNSVSDYVTYEIANVAAGVNTIDVMYDTNFYRGIFEISVADTNTGPFTAIGVSDSSTSTGSAFVSTSYQATFSSAGTKYVKFTVDAINPANPNGTRLGLDNMTVSN